MKGKKSDRVVVAMSGGVDSSVTAAMLVAQGHEVLGVTLALWKPAQGDIGGIEDSAQEIRSARAVADFLGIPHQVIHLEKEFLAQVVRPFAHSYLSGETPSPCVGCNSLIKFGMLWDRMQSCSPDYLATGHYVRIRREDPSGGRLQLFKSGDASKDQSYFLFQLSQDQLSRSLFPLSEMNKAQVRQFAEQAGLPSAGKEDSQEICFIPKGSYTVFLQRYEKLLHAGNETEPVHPSGPIVDQQGRVMGQHTGIHQYTIGQRRGLGIAAKEPLYVLRLNPDQAQVVVGPKDALQCRRLQVGKVNWVSVDAPRQERAAEVKIRSTACPAPAMVYPNADGRVEVEFQHPVWAATPGQAAVFYQGDMLLGGGWIERDYQ